MSETRIRLRQDLRHLDPQLLNRLKSFYAGHRAGEDESREQVAYTSLALLLSGPPTFSLAVDEEDVPQDARRVLGFEKLIREFYQTAAIDSLWSRYKPYYTVRLTDYRPVLLKVIQESLRYFRISPSLVLDRKIFFAVDLLNARGIVNARHLHRNYYLIAGPADDPASNHVRFQHQYLHLLIDPVVEKFADILLKHQELLSLAQDQPRIESKLRDRYPVIAAESLIESILLRLHPGSDPNSNLVRLFREGLIFVPYFYRSLEQYEKDENLSLPSYSENLFTGIQASEIRADENRISTLEKNINAKKQVQQARQQESEERAQRQRRIQSLLTEAGRLLDQKEYGAAREKLHELLREDPESGNAFFYLAQIAFQNKEYERAFQHYQQASEAVDTAPWVRSLALLRMGQFLASRGRFEEARTHFDQVLKMEGELRGAREKARESMERLPSSQK